MLSLWAVMAWLMLGGLSAPYKSPIAPTSDAWIEAKPACIFPLEGTTLPADADSLTAAMSAGLSHWAITPAQPNRVRVAPAGYPALTQLRIDLSNSIEDNDHKPPKVNWHFIPQSGVSA